jgi:hypothetical protein
VVQCFVVQAIPATLDWVGHVPLKLFAPLVLVFICVMFSLSYAYARTRGYVAEGEYQLPHASISNS